MARRVDTDATLVDKSIEAKAPEEKDQAISSSVETHDGVPKYSAAEAEHDLNAFSKMHMWDPNLDEDKRRAIEKAIETHDVDAEIAIEQELEENSPYPEVRAAVQPLDDDVPANTVRAWILGMTFVTIGSGLNLLFSLRQPSISLSSIVAQLLAYPCGLAMARFLPTRQFKTFGIKWTLNPGPFNMKEHTLLVVMSNVSFSGGAAYSTYTIEAMMGFYKINWGVAFALLFTIITQMTGLGLAGIFRNFLVYPGTMIWPSTLPNAALFNTLHRGKAKSDPAATNGWSISRYRFFTYVVLGGFFWYWFPGYIWQGLSVIAWVTWIKPQNVMVNKVFGGYSGFSIGAPFTVLSLDWTQVSAYTGSPLMYPWMAIGNMMIGCVFFTWVVTTAIHFSGSWYSDYLPVSDSASYDNTAKQYNVTRILGKDLRLDVEKYREYSPIYLSTTFALQYGLSFATIISVISHTVLYHGKEIVARARAAKTEPLDYHTRLYSKYKEVPQWWFLVILAVNIALGFVTTQHWNTGLPWWGYLLSLVIAAGFLLPIGMIVAMTNISIGLNVITELIITYMLPGRPIAMMAFKTLGYITMTQAVTYCSDLKLGLYMKVPKRTLFWGQFVASLWSCFVQVGVLFWAFGNIEGLCDKTQPQKFNCPNGRVFFNASIIWGVIGPARMFDIKGTFGGLHWFWVIGLITPVIFWLLAKKFPRGPWRYLHAPIIFGGMGNIPPAVPMNYLLWGVIGFIFNKFLRSRRRGWWMQYNYVLSAALDAGLALGTILIFFTITMTHTNPPKWWGNNVVTDTLDASGEAIKTVLGKGETFGPPAGSWK